MPCRVITDEQLIEMKEMYEQGYSQADMANHFNVTKNTIARWCNKNFERTPYRRARTPKRIVIDTDQIKELHEEGHTYKEIAQILGCATSTIVDRVKEQRQKNKYFLAGVSTNPKYYKVKELLEQGLETNEIAEKLNISKYSVQYYRELIRLNVDQRSFDCLSKQNNLLIKENTALKNEVETLKHELEVAYQIDNYDNSDIPALRRRIYDLEETFDAIKQHFNIGLAQMSSVRYTEYEKQESDDV